MGIPQRAAVAIARLDAWLETMRVDGPVAGYGGPVVHWWRDSIRYCGPAADWRYEGIIHGYLTLYLRTGEAAWLARARRAGDDVVAAQLADGSFANSRFEQNPGGHGTPHEAAAAGGLLALAAALRRGGDSGWTRYLGAARANVAACAVGRLWDEGARLFRDHPARATFVPNKAATLVETLFMLTDATGEGDWTERYAHPTVDAIVRHQVRQAGDALDGAIAQNSFGTRPVEKYFPLYVARCVPALLEAHRRLGGDRYLAAAAAAGRFLERWREDDGGWPQVVYLGGHVNRYPRWVAATGDVLRSLELLRPHRAAPTGADRPSVDRLLAGQLPSGAFRAAEGFGAGILRRTVPHRPDARDLLPVVGWNDKAFRYLAALASPPPTPPQAAGIGDAADALPCRWRGAPATLRETSHDVEVDCGGRIVYRWTKRSSWADT